MYRARREPACLLEDDLARCIDDCDVIIDFTEPVATAAAFRLAVSRNKAIVIGTTAIPPDSLDAMRKTPGARAVISPNMSIGVNLLFSLTEKAAAVLGKGYDAEIIEMHHRLKKDAPSGTALKLRDTIKATEPERPWIDVTGRQGMVGERKPDEIGLFALRGGDIVGEHTVFFAGPGERTRDHPSGLLKRELRPGSPRGSQVDSWQKTGNLRHGRRAGFEIAATRDPSSVRCSALGSQ